ncbi:MAG: cytochrome b/b6 domain-containing protein [Deltaproteobacteria bacterium]|nr:cytochrome b/b6 domain-containing protein [Deltaproteobacteria bacterium]
MAIAGSWVAFAAGAEAPPTDTQCLECHRDSGGLSTPAPKSEPKSDKDGSPFDLKTHRASVHGKVTCVECHTAAKADNHPGGLAKADCAGCHAEQVTKFRKSAHFTSKTPATCKDCHGTHDTLEKKDPKSTVSTERQPETCARCHDGKKTKPAALKGSQLFSITEWQKSIHAHGTKKDGLEESATCASCHGAHEEARSSDPTARVFRGNIPKTCGSCHEGTFEQYMTGAHGQALLKGNTETPICTDCHGEHGIRGKKDPQSSVYATMISKATCPACHNAEHVNRRYGLAVERVDSYRESYHGLADRFGDSTVANCASCHGAHKILHSSNPASSVHPNNLGQTCGKCHPGAGPNWGKGSVHTPDQSTQGGGAIRIVRGVYMFLIGGTIGGMMFYNGLDYFRTLRDNWRKRREEKRVLRFTVGERVQHFLLVFSFFVLVISGFSLKYPDAFWVKALVDLKLSFLARGYVHRVAAVVNVALSVYHLYWLAFTARGREQFKALMPTRSDAKELWHQLRYYVGLEQHGAHFGRFSYVEKVEYLALIWGTIVMVVTGAIMWFPVPAMRFLPKWGWDLAELIHLYEAWLATLSILVWHLYHVAFKPSGHGVSMAMVHGELTEKEMLHEHPAELEELSSLASTESH